MTPEKWINENRVQRRMTIKELSERAGIKYQSLQRALSGKGRINLLDYLRLCVLLDLDPRGYRKEILA